MTERPFDARMAWLCEVDATPARWRTVSLVTAVRALLAHDDRSEGMRRTLMLRSCLEALTSRGIDGDALLRFGFVAELISPLAFRQVVGPVLDQVERDQLDEELSRRGVDTEAWGRVLGQVAPDTKDPIEFAHALAPLFMWVLVAPADRLISLDAPSDNEAQAALRGKLPPSDLMEQYRWIVDRFSSTHLEDWTEKSLHLEFQYLSGDRAAPCPEHLMDDRSVSPAELNAEIAKRAARPTSDAKPYEAALARQMEHRAAELLSEGRRREAAALFEFVLTQEPNSRVALNNLGFCLLLDDTASALEHLRRARAQGYTPLVINVYNEVFGLHLLGRHSQALSVAEENWPGVEVGGIVGGVLWRLRPGADAELAEVADVRAALVELCLSLSSSDDVKTLDAWTARQVS